MPRLNRAGSSLPCAPALAVPPAPLPAVPSPLEVGNLCWHSHWPPSAAPQQRPRHCRGSRCRRLPQAPLSRAFAQQPGSSWDCNSGSSQLGHLPLWAAGRGSCSSPALPQIPSRSPKHLTQTQTSSPAPAWLSAGDIILPQQESLASCCCCIPAQRQPHFRAQCAQRLRRSVNDRKTSPYVRRCLRPGNHELIHVSIIPPEQHTPSITAGREIFSRSFSPEKADFPGQGQV